jgi:tetratricopeptide (TPR) repeat protein
MQYLDLIERRYTGQMTPTELANFETALKTNTILAEEWADFQLIIAGAISAHENSDLYREVAQSRAALEAEGFFDDIERQIDAEVVAGQLAVASEKIEVPVMKVQTNNLWRRWAVAAGLAGLVMAGWLLNQKIRQNSVSSDIVWHQKNYKEYSPITTGDGMTGDSLGDSITVRIRTFLEKGQPDSALAVIAALDGKEESDIYFEGRAYFQKGNYDKAIYILSDLVMEPVHGQMAVKWEAQLILAMCYYNTNQKQAADRTLQAIVEEDPYRLDKESIRKEAGEILKNIR